MIAALTSAAMPNAAIAGARASEQTNPTDEGYGVDHAVVQDDAGGSQGGYPSWFC